MAACQFCHGRYKNPQAVKAHLRFCPPYLAQRERERVPKAVVPSIGSTRAPSPVTCSLPQRGRLLALNLHEKLGQLVKDCQEHISHIHFLERMSLFHLLGSASSDDWLGLYRELMRAQRDAESLVNALTCPRGLPLDLYRQAIAIREKWLNYREEQLVVGFPHEDMHDPATMLRFQEEKERFGIRDEEILFESLLNELKALVSISPR